MRILASTAHFRSGPAHLVFQLRLWLVAFLLFAGFFSCLRVGAAACSQAPVGLIGWWPADGTPIDIVGTNNGILQGGATATAPGLIGSAFTFDGTNSFVQVPDSAVLKPTNFTIEAWVRFTSLDSAGLGGSPAGEQYIIFKQNTRSGDFEGFDLGKDRMGTNDVFRFLVSSSTGQAVQLQSATFISANVWYHLACTRGSNFLQLYVNGQLERQTNVAFAQNYGTLPLFFGTSGQSYWDHKFKGLLDEVSIYNRALASNEIAAIYTAGAAGKCKAVTITAPPQSLTASMGTNVSFTVSASGLAPLGYQWQLNGANIASATGASLGLTNIQSSNSGNYTVIVTNSFGSVTSGVAVLTVVVPPAITTQPLSRTNITDTTAIFTTAASGTAPSYQWRFNAADITGAVGTDLTLTNVQPGDAGNYTVVASNSAGSVTSSVAILTVWVPPAITAQPQNRTNSASTPATFNVTATGTAPLAYQWLFNGTNLAGAISNILTLNNVQPSDGGGYSVVITNSAGSVTSDVAILAVLAPPAITVQPQSRTNIAGSNTIFSATASGAAPLSYQWQFNGTNLPTATSTNLTLTNVQPADAGNYTLAVTNSSGAVTSAVAVLTVWVPPAITGQPQSRTNLAGSTAGLTVSATGTAPLSYQWQANGTNLDNATNADLTLNNVGLADARNYRVVVTNSAAALTSAVAVLTVWVSPAITAQPASRTNTSGTAASFSVAATGTPLPGYRWQFNGADIGGATNASLSVTNVQPANAGNYTVVVTNSAGSVPSDTAVLTVWVAPGITAQPASRTNISGSVASFTIAATGTPPPAYQWQFSGANIGGATGSSLSVTNVQPANAGNYTVVVTNSAGSLTSLAAVLTVWVPPAITTQPASRTNISGTAANFSIAATGTPLPGYRWQFNGADIGGATNASLSVTNVQPANAGNYTVVVTNSAGSVPSAVAVLTVWVSPAITTQPASRTNISGTAANFNVAATGTPLPGYRWQFNGADIGGATNASLSVTNVQPANAGNYTVVVTNSAGSVPSDTAVLTVWVPPAIVAQPQSRTNRAATTATFNAAATGTAPLNYQWLFNSISIPGATTSSLAVTNVQSTNAGNYAVVVTNSGGSASSAAASLTVLLPQVVLIPDPNLEATIRSAANKPAGLLNNFDMEDLIFLPAAYRNITNLSGLEWATNLAFLQLSGNSVTNLAPLQGLYHLDHLLLDGNGISDLSALSPLTNLAVLNAGDNLLTTAAAVANFRSLSGLWLYGNSLSNLTFVSGLNQLDSLGVANNHISDLSPLATLTNLSALTLDGNPISDYSTLSVLTTLTNLSAAGGSLSNLTVLQGLRGLVILNLDHNRIGDVSPLAALTNLSYLALGGNPATSYAALAGLTNLVELELAGNSISNLAFLQGLRALANLYLDLNVLTDLSPLTGLTNLNGLSLGHNRLTDLAAIQNLPQLQWLDLRWNPLNVTPGAPAWAIITSLQNQGVTVYLQPLNQPPALWLSSNWTIATNATSALGFFVADDVTPAGHLLVGATSSNTGLIANSAILVSGTDVNRTLTVTPAPNQAGTATITVTVTDETGLSSNSTVLVTVLAPQVVPIPDSNLQAALRSVLGKPTGNLTSVDLQALTCLYAHDTNITVLSGLEWATNLTTLYLGGNSISNVAALSHLSQLTSLFLYHNFISDLSPLTGLTNLTCLDLRGNPISNYEAVLSAFPNLTSLYLGGDSITNLTFLQPLGQLAFLGLDHNQVGNLAPLGALPSLRGLDLSYNPLTNLAQAGVLSNLTGLWLSGNLISNLTALQSLPGLTSLTLYQNRIGDLSPISGLSNLLDLGLSWNPLTNYGAALAPFPNLTSLWLDGYAMGNSDFPQSLTRLKALGLRNNRLSDLAALGGLTNLIALHADLNRLTNIGALQNLPQLWYADLRTNLLDLTAGSGAMNGIQALTNRGVTVLCVPQNQPPTIAFPVATWTIAANATSPPLPFSASDDVTPSAQLLLTGSSSNTALIPNNSILLVYTNDQRTLMVTPAPNQTGVAAITVTVTDETGLTNRASVLITVVVPPLVVIPDPQLEAAIRSALGKMAGNLNSLDLQALTNLFAANLNIANLSGLEWATNLSTLILDSNSITNLAPLQNLRQLTFLGLNDNRIADLSPLAGLTNLGLLYLEQNRLTNLAALQNLPRLGLLDVPLNLLDVSPKSPALSVIQDLINRGASVNYLPQRHPPVISVRSTWLVNTNSSALVSFTVADDGPARDPLVVTGTSSNPALLPNVNMVFGHNGNSFWTLGVTPVPNQTGASTLTLTATDAAGLMSNTNIALTVLGFQPLTGPLLNNTNLAVTTSGALPWFGQSIVTHDGVSAAQSGAIGDNQESWLQTSVSGPGTLSFWWKVSSETNFDWLEFYLNGVLQTNRISGEVNWQQQFVALPAGAQTLRWRYSKDPYCCAVGSDAAWLDQVDFVMASWLELVGVSTNGQCLLILHGIPGKTYNLQVSTNLVTWSSQALITATNSVMPFVDTAAGPGPRFYRLQEITSGVIWLDKPGMRGSGYQWVLHSPPGLRFELQASTNLTTWTALQVITNIVGATPCTDALATNWPKRFYRAKLIF